MATQLAERSADPVAVFRQTLTTPAFREQLKMALPDHIPVDRFIRVAVTAVQQTPDLLTKADRRSLFGALTKAAQSGLLPDGEEGVMVVYNGKVQWQPMVRGIQKKVRNSGEIASWDAVAVFEKDKFQRLLGDDMRIYHEPYDEGDPGEVVGAYSIVTFRDGTKSKDYMPRWRIERARQQSRAPNSLMWTKFYDEGAVKTVMRRHAKRLPQSTDLEVVFSNDDTIRDHGRPEPDAETPTEITPEPSPPVSRLDALEHHIQAERGPDPDEAQAEEVIEEQAEELEAEIEQPAVNDEHPGKAIADAIIAEINSPENNAVMDIARVLTKHELDITALADEDAVRVEVAADKKRNAIREEQAKAKGKQELAE
jgi:recombination protein RecT